jgi:transaldolase/glucose-6-phosphate isomerase
VTVRLTLALGEHESAFTNRLRSWEAGAVGERVWNRDHTVWSPQPQPELTDRLGWLTLPVQMASRLESLEAFGATIADEGFTDVVVLGMGGSSLAPEVYQETFGNAVGSPRLRVLDSTHPEAVIATAAAINLASTLFVVSSKSGGTLETMSFFRYFWHRIGQLTPEPGSHFIAVTDPGSRLADLAAERGFRATFLAPPDVGGRYSALTVFGLVPAAAIGADLPAMQEAATAAAAACAAAVPPQDHPGMLLGAAMGELALAGRDKVTFLTSESLLAFPAWIEQLIAESTGKHGRGIVPVGGEPPVAAYGDDRFFVVVDTDDQPLTDVVKGVAREHPVAHLTLEGLPSLAAAMFVFEFAVALAGSVLEINPFDQPDVQLAKDLAKRAMAGELETTGTEPMSVDDPELAATIEEWIAGAAPPDYIGIHAYLRPTIATRHELQATRSDLGAATAAATTIDFGPRFLHSTGQLHKGGPNTGRFLQIVDRPAEDLPVPETDYTFSELITAQGIGDFQALRDRSRRVLRVSIGKLGIVGVERLRAIVADVVRG